MAIKNVNTIKDNRVQVLISTFGQEDLKFLEKMNLQTDVVVGNQRGENSYTEVDCEGKCYKIICSDKVGLSNNRNLTLENADCEICIIGDDDVRYVDNYENLVLGLYKKYSDADMIIFNLYEKPITRYVTKKAFRVNQMNYMRFGSVRITLRLEKILEKGFEFDSNFGTGAIIPCGEDTIFLHDCLKAGLKIYAVPDYILELVNERDSTWFKGYDENYFINKGKLYRRISRLWFLLFCLQDVIRHRNLYKGDVSFWKSLFLMYKGKKLLKKEYVGHF